MPVNGNRNDLLQILAVAATLIIWALSRTRFGPAADIALVILAIGWRAFRSRNGRAIRKEEG